MLPLAPQCHQKLEEGLERQHTKLQKTLEELRAYQKQHEKWANMNSKVIRNPCKNFLCFSNTIVIINIVTITKLSPSPLWSTMF